ncbi:mucin-5AC-like [Anopheles stephensi]|uniref:mucin-5AC-like n=1 Tax=Anopheles stephensi TaxID=30069 RepID=UPI001658B88B|nr:mucin-5AC-like [Anopheles stephensi]XP_035899343.1 mucin-5AC-like [Anopheles stephensi]
MLLQVLVPCLALLQLSAAGYVTVPLHSPASVTYVNPQQHVGLLAGPVRYTSGAQQPTATLVEERSGAVSVTPGPAPTYYSYNVQPQPVFGKDSYTPAVQYHHTTYGSPSVRVFEPKSFVYGFQGASVPTTHTVQSVPVSVSTTQYHHTSAPIPVPVTPVPQHHHVAVPVPTPVPVHVPVHVPVAVPVTPTYTKTVTTGPTYIPPQEKQIPVVRSRKFKVRRPAIQNQFYDIEERVIIRPVGSALVELEQPISQTETQTKTTKTTTTFVEKRPVYSTPAPEVHFSEEGAYGTRTVGTTIVEKRPVYSTPAPEVHISQEGSYGTRTVGTTIVEKRPVYSTPAPEVHISEEGGYGTRTVGRPQVVTQTTTVYTERPPLKGGYDRIEVAAQSKKLAASTSKASDAEFIDTQQVNTQTQRPYFTQGHAIYHGHQQTAFVNPYATHLAPHPFVYHPANAGHLLHHVAYVGQHSPALVATHPSTAAHPASVFHIPSSTPLYPVAPAVGADCDHDGNGKAPEYLPPAGQTPSSTTPSQPPVATTTPKPPTSVTPGSYPADDMLDDEYDDSIVIDARSGANNYSDYSSTDSEYADATVTAATTTANTPIVYHHDKYRGAEQTQTRLGGSSSIEVSYATRTTPASDIVAFDPSTASGTFDFGPSYRGSFPTTTFPPSPTTIQPPTTIGSSSSTSSSSSTTPQRSVTVISSTTPRTVSARFSETDASSTRTSDQSEYSSRSTSGITSQSVVVGQGLTQEQIHANQEQFIKLLSERDSIAQVGFGPKGDTSGTLIDAYVRSRVLSATPAPRDSKETSRTVNIRRIVVSRPVETEQEVEVREQSYATTIAPPSYEHKRDVSEVTPAEGAERQLPPVYVNAKPPAFANDRDQ